MCKKMVYILLIFSSFSVFGDERYDQMLKSQAHSQTINTLATSMLTMPYKTADTLMKLKPYFWYNHKDVKISPSNKQIEDAKLKSGLNRIAVIIKDYDIRKLNFYGVSLIGHKDYVDFYYSYSTPKGPGMIRVSLWITGHVTPKIFNYEIFEGWGKSREIIKEVEHKSGKHMASVSIPPEFYKSLKDSIAF